MKTLLCRSLFVLALFILAGLAVSPVFADSIGIKFTGNSVYMSPLDQPGVRPGGNWNNIDNASGAGIMLQGSNGALTPALLSFNATGIYSGFSALNTLNAATNRMYSAGLYADPELCCEISVSITNIPYTQYDVYVFASADTSDGSELSITDGISTYYYSSDGDSNAGALSLLETASMTPGSPTAGQAQYQRFAHLNSSNFSLLTGGSLHQVLSNNIFGIQIVQTPEPSALLLIAGAFGALAYRKLFKAQRCDWIHPRSPTRRNEAGHQRDDT